MVKRLLMTGFALLFIAGPSWADEWDRPGWFVGAGGGLGVDFLSSAFENATAGIVEIGEAGTFNFRGGYRVWSWFAFELMYEGIYDIEARAFGQKIATSSTHSFVPNFKFIVPTWRIHPYFALGPGLQYGQFDAIDDSFDLDRTDFVLRMGIGLDGYITENWLVNLEAAPSIRFKDWGDIASRSTDNVSLTFTGGVQYRF